MSIGKFKWLTVVSPEDPDGVEVLLEPNNNPVAETYQKEIFEKVFLPHHSVLKIFKQSLKNQRILV